MQFFLDFDFDHYSSLPGPAPGPEPPGLFYLTRSNGHLGVFSGKIRGRTKCTAPLDAPIYGIGVAPGWLTDTRPGRTHPVRLGAILWQQIPGQTLCSKIRFREVGKVGRKCMLTTTNGCVVYKDDLPQ